MATKPPHPDDVQIGHHLKLARKALGLSQVEVAAEIGVSVQRWNNYETGVRPLSPVIMRRFARRYGISLDWIQLGQMAGLTHAIARKIAALEAEAG